VPAGTESPVIGYVTFCAVKLIGYSLAARMIALRYKRPDQSALVIGGVRTLIGMVAGAAYFSIWSVIPFAAATGGIGYLAGLMPVRVAEWRLLLTLYFERECRDIPRTNQIIWMATAWSYILDIPAIMGFVVTGGIWIC
jgi:hypothetical protein